MRNLLEFFLKYHNWLLFLILEAASVALLFRYNNYQGSVWFTSSNAVAGKVYEVSSAVESFFRLAGVNEDLARRNFYLERQVNQLSRLYAEAVKDSTAAERLERETLSRYTLTPAKVVDNSICKPLNLITIDKGRADGVEPDMGVVSGSGVVGIVYMAAQHYAVVMPVINVRSRISAAIRRRGFFGHLCWYGTDPLVAYVEDVPRHARFNRGDWVETSGFSSIFPAGVSVGRIEQVYNSPDGVSYRLKVRLSTDFGRLRDVFVITDKDMAERAGLLNAAADSLRLGAH